MWCKIIPYRDLLILHSWGQRAVMGFIEYCLEQMLFFHTCTRRQSVPYSGQMFYHDTLFLMPLCVLAERSCSWRWQMWWWRMDGRRLDMSLCALMIAGPHTRGTPRGVCRLTPRGFPVGSKNWQIMWVFIGIIKEATCIWLTCGIA